MHCLVLLLVVRVVKVVIAHLGELVVRVICHVDSYRKNYVGNWIFRFSLFILHLNNHYVCIYFVQV